MTAHDAESVARAARRPMDPALHWRAATLAEADAMEARHGQG